MKRALIVLALAAQAIPGPQGTHTENGLAGFAKILCSGVFVSNRTPDDVAQGSAARLVTLGPVDLG